MIRALKRLSFVILLMSLWLEPLVAAEVCNRVVAVVNNDVITLYELNNRMKEMTGVPAEELKLKSEAMYLDARGKILELLIDEKIAQAKIKELRIQVSDKQVDSYIEKVKRDNQLTQEDLVAVTLLLPESLPIGAVAVMTCSARAMNSRDFRALVVLFVLGNALR